MNYILEINAFNEWKFRNSPSTGQISLWFALIDLNSKCGWKEWFGVANITLMTGTGLSRAAIVKCREFLQQQGLIDVKVYGPNKAADYKMISFASQNLYIPVGIPVDIQVVNEVINAGFNEMAASQNVDIPVVIPGYNEPPASQNLYIPVDVPVAQSTTTLLKNITTTATTSESPMTIMDAHTKVFGSYNMNGFVSAYVMKLKSQGYDDNFIIEIMLEMGESTSKPSARLMETIGERWIKDGIKSRTQAKTEWERKKEGDNRVEYGRRNEGVRLGGHTKESVGKHEESKVYRGRYDDTVVPMPKVSG